MTEIARILNEFTPGAYGIWCGVLMFAGWWLREWRETRKLSSADRQARREGYAKQVEQLTTENRKLRGDLEAADNRHDEYRRVCQKETDQLRDEIRGLEDEVSGLKRRLDAQGSAYVRAITDGVDAPATMTKLLQNMEGEK